MKKYIVICLASLALSSCSDFLTQLPEHSLVQENAVRNYSDAQHIVNGIYGVYEGCSNLGGYLYTDLHCMAGFYTYQSTFYNMGYTQTSGAADAFWTQLYKCINAANAAIIGISGLDDTAFPSVSDKERLLAEARCFRGFSNLQLLWYYSRWFDSADSPYGIIYRDQVSELSNLQTSRCTVGESYQYVLDDLTYAEEHLGDYESARTVSKQFAKVLHAKLLLVRGWDGDYAEALNIVNDLLASPSANFQMETDLAKVYQEGWDNKEVLFSRYIGDNTGSYFGMAGSEFMYSYGLWYNNEFTEIPQQWLEEDPRASIIFGEARAPETWDDRTKDGILVKLYHNGRYAGKNDMYATYIFRFPELYLMKAELLARTNPSDIQGALAPINEMRAKYTNPVFEPITGITSHQELMDTIFKEYVINLFLENETPWFASLRFEKDGKPWINTLKPDVSFSENQYCWPIPDDEITTHSNTIEQNPGLE